MERMKSLEDFLASKGESESNLISWETFRSGDNNEVEIEPVNIDEEEVSIDGSPTETTTESIKAGKAKKHKSKPFKPIKYKDTIQPGLTKATLPSNPQGETSNARIQMG